MAEARADLLRGYQEQGKRFAERRFPIRARKSRHPGVALGIGGPVLHMPITPARLHALIAATDSPPR